MSQSPIEEYQDIEIAIGQRIEFVDENDVQQWGRVLQVDEDMDMVYVTYGLVIQSFSWVHANEITSA